MNDDLFAKLVRNEMSLSTYENGGKPVDFEVGARVKLIGEYDEFDQIGATGTIRIVGKFDIGVEWDEGVHYYSFHHLDQWKDGENTRYAPSGRGYWVDKSCLEVV